MLQSGLILRVVRAIALLVEGLRQAVQSGLVRLPRVVLRMVELLLELSAVLMRAWLSLVSNRRQSAVVIVGFYAFSAVWSGITFVGYLFDFDSIFLAVSASLLAGGWAGARVFLWASGANAAARPAAPRRR